MTIVESNGFVYVVGNVGGSCIQECELLLDFHIQSIMELIDVHGIIIVQVSHKSLEIGPVCYSRAISLLDCFKLSSCDFLAISFSECMTDGYFEVLPSFIFANSFFLHRRLDLGPGISSASGAGIVDVFGVFIKFVGFAIELKFTLYKECSEF
jgi:hypothetical protein